MSELDDLKKSLSREAKARQAAEDRTEELTAELYETSAALQYRTQIVAEKSAGLRQANEELEQLQLRLMHSEKMAKIGLLVTGVAEEIANPLGFIAANMNSLYTYFNDMSGLIEQQKEALGATPRLGYFKTSQARKVGKLMKRIDFDFIKTDINKLLEDSLGGISRVQTLVEDLTEFSSTDRREITEEDINNLLDRTLHLASNELHYKADIVKQYGTLPKILCDSSLLVQAFLNLLFNAVEAIQSKGTIMLRTGTHSSMIWVDIADTGEGIADENLGKIFNPFFSTKTSVTGSGLGLHQVKTVVEAHSGRTTVMSRQGKGTTFRLMLPVDRYAEGQ